MFDETPELAPNLEWMLQSGQAGDDMITAALVREYYSPIHRLTQLVLTKPEFAHRATVETLATAIHESHRYAGVEGIQVWLLAIALRTCKKISAQTKRKGCEPLSIDSKTPVLRAEQTIIRDDAEERAWQKEHLESAQRTIGERIDSEHMRETLPDWLSQSLQRRWPPHNLPAWEIERIQTEVKERVREVRRARRRLARFQELGLVGLVIACVAAVIGFANLLFAQPEFEAATQASSTPHASQGTPTARPNQENRSTMRGTINFPAPTPVTPVPSLDPLNIDTDVGAIHRRMEVSSRLWNTLWADVYLYFFGPTGYVGPPMIYRHQVWIARDQGSLQLSGPLEGPAENASLATRGIPPPDDPILPLETVQQAGGDYPWFVLSIDKFAYSGYLTQPFQIAQQRTGVGVTLQAVGEEEVAGRQALILDQVDPDGNRAARYWIDVITGMTLRERYYGGKNYQLVLFEAIVNSVYFDVNFNPHTLDRNRNLNNLNQFYTDYTGRAIPEPHWLQDLSSIIFASRKRLPKYPIPPGFNPSRSWLTFQYGPDFRLGSGEKATASVFAGDFYLGDLVTGDPLSLRCKRSPDGTWLAFVDTSRIMSGPNTPLYWVNLSELGEVHIPFPEGFVSEFAFSPDSSKLAYSAYHFSESPSGSSGGLYIADLHSGDVNQASGWDEGYLVDWSQDGNAIVFLQWEPDFQHTVIALHLETGQTFIGETLPSDGSAGWELFYTFPELGWEGVHSYIPPSLESCSKPPGIGGP